MRARSAAPEPLIADGQAARAALLRGIDQMTRLLRPTLGPLARTVAVGRLVGRGPPEVLDSAAIIARRTLQLGDPFENMGAMLVRHLAWRMFDEAGDGAATAAVVAHALITDGMRHVAASANPVHLGFGIEAGVERAVEALASEARRIELPSEIAGVVGGITRDAEVARLIGEVVDAVGPDGAIMIEDAQGTRTTVEYVEGARWQGGYVSEFLLDSGASAVRVLNPRVFVTDYALEQADQLVPAVEACLGSGVRTLLVVAPDIGDSAIGLLVLNRQRGVLEGVVAVRAPCGDEVLDDIAVLTGARCLKGARQDRLADVTAADLGSARQAWATRANFGIIGGGGSKSAIRDRLAHVRAELKRCADDPTVQATLTERIGKLSGAASIVRVGATSLSEHEDLKLRVQAAIRCARSAVVGGVVPGGGAALLACAPDLDDLGLQGDVRLGAAALAKALAAPMHVMAQNAGFDPRPIVVEARRRGLPWTFDLVQGTWVDAWQAGVVDPLAIEQAAVRIAASVATTVLSSEVLVRRRRPPMALTP